MTTWNDFNSADDQNSFDLIPKGTLVKVRMTIRPGGYDDASQGWTGGYATQSNTTGSIYLNCEFVVLDGPYAKRKMWSLIGLHSPKGPEWANMGRAFIKGILNSARGLHPQDNTPQTQQARRIQGFSDLDGIEFVAKVEMEKDQNGDDKNVVKTAITPDSKDYAAVMGRINTQPTVPASKPATTAAPSGRPSWAQQGGRRMILRPRQKLFVERSLTALKQHQNTLGVAPTGAGKTIMLSGVTGQWLAGEDAKACVLAHRDELTTQNETKFRRVNPSVSTSVFDAHAKSWDGQATFAMVQTLGRDSNLQNMPTLDLLVIDEAHHAAAPTYRRIIDHVRDRNPKVAIFGVTATPNRGDKKGLRPIFSNVSDQITLAELISSGHLVPPRTFVIDVGTQSELSQVKRAADDFDMTAVDAIMNKAPITDAVIRHWKDKAHDRPTVVFCSTVNHARNVAEAFAAAGFSAELIHGELTTAERQAALGRFQSGESQIIVNVAVLTEGWDFPPTSCVILLRPSSYKSTLIQMIGRGLRTVDPSEHPGVTKSDCIVLDFGTSTLLHGSLEQDVNLDGHEGLGEAPQKECPGCGAMVPAATRECSLCGHVWERTEGEGKVDLSDFVMSEIDLLKRSSFRWCDLFGDDAALMATGFEAWAGVFFLAGHWYGMGGGKKQPARLLAKGDRTVCLAAADDWLNEHETEDAANKSRKWLNQAVTAQQLRYLPPAYRKDFGLTRYQASCLLAFQFNKRDIQSRIFNAAERRGAA